MSKYRMKTTRERQEVIELIEKLNPDKAWIITVNRPVKKRTKEQNGLYWGWINIISKAARKHKNDIHDYLAEKFLPKREVIVFGETKIKPLSTTDLTTVQFNTYLEKINIEMAFEEGIILPWPQDKYFKEQYNATKENIG